MLSTSAGVSKILLGEVLETNKKQGSHSIGLDPTLVLMPTKADPTTKGQSGKGCTIRIGDTGGVKFVLTLLTGVVAFHVRFTIGEVKETRLQWPLSGALLAWFRRLA